MLHHVRGWRDIATASRDTDTFSSWEGGIFPHPDQVIPLDLTRNLLLYMDPPQHTKYRKILQTAFIPNSVAKLEDRVRAIVGEALDAAGEGRCDFVRDVAVPIPLRTLMMLMGLPREDEGFLTEWIEGIEAATVATEPASATSQFVELAGYLGERIAAQKEAGEDSLVTTLVEAEVDGEGLTDDEILVFFGLLIFAGNDTTRNTMAGGMLALLEHPDQLELLRAEPERIEAAVEEILRWTSVVKYFCRTATADAELGGCPIARGREDRHALPGRLARRRRQRGPRVVRREARRAQAHGLRRRRAPLLPRRRPRPPRAARRLRGDPEPVGRDPPRRRARAPAIRLGERPDLASDRVRTQGETASMSTSPQRPRAA